MSITSILPPFILMTVFIFLANQITNRVSFFENLIKEKRKNPTVHLPIDGLRGFLALSVFFCHSVVAFLFLKTGIWDVAPSRFYSFLGPFGVLLFFFITGYLFWMKCLSVHRSFKILSFLKSRFRRIMPAYLASFCIILFIVGIKTHFTLQVTVTTLTMQIFKWLILGVPFADYPFINQYIDTGIIDAGVYWTLRFEILFYLILPLMAFFAKGLRLIPLLVFFGAIFFWDSHYQPSISNKWFSVLVDFSRYMTLGFSFGMISAYLKKRIQAPYPFLLGPVGVIIAIGFLLLQFIFIHDVHQDNYQYRQSLLLFIPFLLIVFGNTFFGILESSAALFLGSISYSIYLFHGIILFIILGCLNLVYPVEALNPWCFWGLIGLIGIVTICVSAISYRYIEDKWMK
jgi:peptidoglycan/LPS O-acetylase OafA/YrhL